MFLLVSFYINHQIWCWPVYFVSLDCRPPACLTGVTCRPCMWSVRRQLLIIPHEEIICGNTSRSLTVSSLSSSLPSGGQWAIFSPLTETRFGLYPSLLFIFFSMFSPELSDGRRCWQIQTAVRVVSMVTEVNRFNGVDVCDFRCRTMKRGCQRAVEAVWGWGALMWTLVGWRHSEGAGPLSGNLLCVH